MSSFLCAFKREVTLRKGVVGDKVYADTFREPIDHVRESYVPNEDEAVYVYQSKYSSQYEILGDFSAQDSNCLLRLYQLHGFDRIVG